MEKLDILIDGHPVALTSPPLLKNGMWLVPLESFSEHIGAKVEYPQASEMAIICRADRCLPLKIGKDRTKAVMINEIAYARPAVIAEPFGFQVETPSLNRMEIVKGDVSMTGTGNTAGQLAPDFTLLDLDGSPRSLSDFRGKKTLLYIWGSW